MLPLSNRPIHRNTHPAGTLDVSGGAFIRGTLQLPATGTATATKGFNSQPQDALASAFNSGTHAAVNQHFRWQAEPAGNNTSSPSGNFNLLFASGNSVPTETGLSIGSKGLITFASGQKFPGTGTVTSVGLSAPGSDFTVSGSPVTTSGTLALGWKVVPTSADTPNAIVKRDGTGSFSAQNIAAISLTAANPAGVAIVASTSSANAAITGTSTGGNAVSDGVDGVTSSASASGVAGINNSGGTSSVGVYGSGGTAVYGNSTATSGVGVYGSGDTAVYGQATASGDGLYAVGGRGTYGGSGVLAYGAGGSGAGFDGVGGEFVGGRGTRLGDGVDAFAGSGVAGYFHGDVNVVGNLTKGGGSFKIDHPLDPANKYLYHSFVESPDMKNIYDGVATLDANGEAVIQMPEWFGVLNRDFRYQLTCIGGFAPVYIAEEISNNQFKIAGGKSGMKISWQVTGIRQDAWANAHRIPVEEEKNARERGYYLHPELYGAPEEKQIEWARHPDLMKRMKERQAPSHPANKFVAPAQTLQASK